MGMVANDPCRVESVAAAGASSFLLQHKAHVEGLLRRPFRSESECVGVVITPQIRETTWLFESMGGSKPHFLRFEREKCGIEAQVRHELIRQVGENGIRL